MKRWPDAAWAPLSAGLLMLWVGLVGLALHQPLLFPSLGPTAFLLAETPDQPASRPYNTLVGHGAGLLAGLISVWVTGTAHAASVLATHDLTAPRALASVLAVVMTLLALTWLRAQHPPAAATTLLVALGGIQPTVHGVAVVVGGVLLLEALGEPLRRWRLSARTE